MAGFDGSGNYVVRYIFVQDAAAGIMILASRQDQQWADMAGGFNNCLTRDGQGGPTADINWNGFKITNVGNATAANGVPSLQQVQQIGIRYAYNPITNPCFSVSQRNANNPYTPGAAGGWTMDHWYLRRAAGAVGNTRVVPQAGDTGNPWFTGAAFGRTSGDTNTDEVWLVQSIESINSRKLIGYQNNTAGVVTIVSLWLRNGSTLPVSTVTIRLRSTSTSDAAPFGAATWSTEGSLVMSSSGLSTTTYTRVSFTTSAPTFTGTATLNVTIALNNTEGTAGADSLLYVTGVKLEQQIAATGSSPTAFEPQDYEEDLARCQRYFQTLGFAAANTISFTGSQTNTKVFDNTISLITPMFRVPTATVFGTWAVTSFAGNPSVVTGNNSSIILRNTANATAWGAILADSVDDGIFLDAELTA